MNKQVLITSDDFRGSHLANELLQSEYRHGRAHCMTAAVLAEPGRICMATVPIPELGPKRVRVRLTGCGVCASNLSPWEGKPWFTYPMEASWLGHKGWGVVDAVGAEVDQFSPGDQVAMISRHAYAQDDVVSEDAVAYLPHSVKDLPFPGEPIGGAMNIFRRSEIRAGQPVAMGIGNSADG